MSQVATASVERFPCPHCGADTELAPGTDSLFCKSCGKHSEISAPASDEPGPEAQGAVHEHDFSAALARVRSRPARELAVGAREVQCQNCGARTVVTQQATRCPFCDHAMVIELATADVTIEPQGVLPFAISKEAAAEHFLQWLRGLWFAPRKLSERARKDGLDGVYLPHWTYDSRTITDYRGQRGEYYWVTESYTDSKGNRQTRQVRKTRWYSASGRVRVAFDDVLVCASESLPRKLTTKLEPWDLPAVCAFDGKYLAGFTAERYQVDLEAGFALAEQRMEPDIRAAIRRDIGGDEQRIHEMHVRHEDVTFKHLLLPVWLSAFHFRERVFRVMVNARTGEVAGERPWSWVKITALVLVVLALIGGIVYAVSARRAQAEQEAQQRNSLPVLAPPLPETMPQPPALPEVQGLSPEVQQMLRELESGRPPSELSPEVQQMLRELESGRPPSAPEAQHLSPEMRERLRELESGRPPAELSPEVRELLRELEAQQPR